MIRQRGHAEKAQSSQGCSNHTRDIYRYFILDDAFETARFLKRPRIKRK
ncbi:MAG: hypothetical protein K2L17_05125 [Muribaculaceae bacterium]|nr:hypothetical protein [Muribaculaceae bacterium]